MARYSFTSYCDGRIGERRISPEYKNVSNAMDAAMGEAHFWMLLHKDPILLSTGNGFTVTYFEGGKTHKWVYTIEG